MIRLKTILESITRNTRDNLKIKVFLKEIVGKNVKNL